MGTLDCPLYWGECSVHHSLRSEELTLSDDPVGLKIRDPESRAADEGVSKAIAQPV